MTLERIASLLKEFSVDMSIPYIMETGHFNVVGAMPYSRTSILCVAVDEIDNVLKAVSDNFINDYEYGGKEFILGELIDGGYYEAVCQEDLPVWERCEGKEGQIACYLITAKNIVDYIQA